MIGNKADYSELCTILKWISNFAYGNNVIGLRKVQALANHPSPSVRLGVAHVLSSMNDPQSIKILLRLMSDSSPKVRDWATFGIGDLCDEDSDCIRNALAERLTDKDEETRDEAVYGLAKRKDRRAFKVLLEEIESGEPSRLLIQAAGEFGGKRFLPSLRRLLRESKNEEDFDPWLLAELKCAVSVLTKSSKRKQMVARKRSSGRK